MLQYKLYQINNYPRFLIQLDNLFFTHIDIQKLPNSDFIDLCTL